MFEKLRNLDAKGKNIFEIVLVIVFSVGFLAYYLITDAIEAKKTQEESMKVVLVTDASRYMTVIGCARKFIDEVQSGNKDNLLILINDDYKEKNNISVSNIHNFFPQLEQGVMYDYEGGTMYQHRLSKNVVEYFLEGNIKKNILDEVSTSIKYDMTITLYENEFTFSIRPGIGDLKL